MSSAALLALSFMTWGHVTATLGVDRSAYVSKQSHMHCSWKQSCKPDLQRASCKLCDEDSAAVTHQEG